jgi:hypothetical protein
MFLSQKMGDSIAYEFFKAQTGTLLENIPHDLNNDLKRYFS